MSRKRSRRRNQQSTRPASQQKQKTKHRNFKTQIIPEEFIHETTSNGTALWKMSEDGVSTKHQR